MAAKKVKTKFVPLQDVEEQKVYRITLLANSWDYSEIVECIRGYSEILIEEVQVSV